MTPIQIILVAFVIVLLYLIYTYTIGGSSNKLTGLLAGDTQYEVPSSTISSIAGNNSLYNYTISLWIYIDSWSATTDPKPVLNVPSPAGSTSTTNVLEISLGAVDNNLSVTLYPLEGFSIMNTLTPAPLESMTAMNPKKKSSAEGMANIGSLMEGVYQKVTSRASVKKAEGMSVKEGIDNLVSVVPAIPLQSWTNVCVNVNGRALDIYINGKLIQSSVLPYVPKPLNPEMILSPDPGFSGWTSNLQFYQYNLSPKQIYNIYKNGYTGSPEGLFSVLGRYSMKIVFVDNSQNRN